MAETRRTTTEEARRVGDEIGVDWDRFDLEQFRFGMDVEFEHGSHDPQTDVTGDDPILTGKIALAHMKEFPDYYDRLQRMEAYAERALPADTPIPRQIRITQRGEMWQKPDGRAMRFTATQSLAVERVAFSWQARFPLVGPLALRVVDDYADGDGKLEVRLFGLPLQRQRDPETVAGEALRYLAELPFVPPAIVHNRELEWRQLDERRVEVSAHLGGERLVVELELNEG